MAQAQKLKGISPLDGKLHPRETISILLTRTILGVWHMVGAQQILPKYKVFLFYHLFILYLINIIN